MLDLKVKMQSADNRQINRETKVNQEVERKQMSLLIFTQCLAVCVCVCLCLHLRVCMHETDAERLIVCICVSEIVFMCVCLTC